MVKIAYPLFALFLLCTAAYPESMPVLTYTDGLCTDSDGWNPYTGGNVSALYIDRGTFSPDSCVDETTVIEWYCMFMGIEKKSIYSCPAGYVCRAGACALVNAPGPPAPAEGTCLDADGMDENLSGKVTVYLAGDESYSLTDRCVGWFNVSEAYCMEENGTSVGKYISIACANGSYCMDGLCVNHIKEKPATVFAAPEAQPAVRVTRDLPYVAQAGTNLTVSLKVTVDPSQAPCAYGISEKIPAGWDISGVSPPGVAGRYPGNGSVRMSEALAALNSWCMGNASTEEAFSRFDQWMEAGVAGSVVEWIILDPAKNASSYLLSYTMSIPDNASVNSDLYGDSTWDAEKYHRTGGNYRIIVQQPMQTTTSTTTTLFQVSLVSGMVLFGEKKLPVPGAKVTILCAGNTESKVEIRADDYGYYTTEMSCPVDSEVSSYASTAPGEICFGPYDCTYYGKAKGSSSGTVSSRGYARIDVILSE
ncbi:MAG: hypothetical protein WAX07_07610 [Candidatus Altiarchaeia archaeon]